MTIQGSSGVRPLAGRPCAGPRRSRPRRVRPHPPASEVRSVLPLVLMAALLVALAAAPLATPRGKG
jgi:hypothetical protein